MSEHTCKELTPGCYRCELNHDEIQAYLTEDRMEAQVAWLAYRNAAHMQSGDPHRTSRCLRKREFIAGFMAGRTY